MDPKTAQILLGAAGSGGAAAATYVDDVFSTFLYDGTSATKTVTNGIDFSGEGGLAWIKARNLGFNHYLFDTERGAQKYLRSDQTDAEVTATNLLSSFNSDGFSLGNGSATNSDSGEFVSWNFRKAPGFFDVVTYTGDGTVNRPIAHSLGSTPGMIMVKRTDSSGDWSVWHRGSHATWTGGTTAGDASGGNATGKLFLNSNAAYDSGAGHYTFVNSTHFGVRYTNLELNTSGASYVAYVFAHDDQSFGTDGDEAIIKCGSYSGNGTPRRLIDLGFEPQWLLHRRSNSTNDWKMFDVMRGMDHEDDQQLKANENDAELAIEDSLFTPTPTGFIVESVGSSYNQSGGEYIYVAIRRPHKPPEAGTDVFAVDNQGTGTMPPQYHSGFPVDWAFTVAFAESQTYRDREAFTRLIGRKRLKLNEATAETSFSSAGWDYMDGWHDNNSSVSTTYSWMFKRAPGFFDIVTYDGTGSARTINHNLGVVPEIVLTKKRSGGDSWYMGSEELTDWTKALQLTATIAEFTSTSLWNSTAPTSSVFSLGTNVNNNQSGQTFVAYLFASLDGISKIGTYTGTGSNVDVDCGFSAGARFVLIKRTDSTGDWYVWDSTRGIVSGNDPYFLLNTDDADVTNTDYLDPLNAGFTVTSSAPAALNTSGGTYLFLAIA